VTRLAAFVFSELAEASATLASFGEARSEKARRVYLDVVRGAIGSAGGRELASAGDGVLAVFESASDALAFALCVQRGCDRESRRSGERLDVRVGVEVGETASDDSAGAADAARRAQQLARAADAGSVLATNLVAALATGGGAAFRPAGLLELPGSAEPVSAVEVVWERKTVEQAPLPAELESGGGPTPFVGRAAEQARLSELWRQTLAGGRQLAFVLGEPGIGKTRLVAEFARALHDQGAAILWGRSFEEALTPYQPFVQALRHHARWTPPEELRTQVGSASEVLGRLLPELQTRIPITGESVEDPESERYRLFEGVSRLLGSASAERPILFVLDDLQWADQGTLLLLKHIARDAEPATLFLLGTYRHSEVGREHPLALVQADVERDRVVERIELSGLADDECGTLVGALIGWEPPDDVIRSLCGETEGNPFFLEEVVRHLEQLGLSHDPERLARVQATVQELGVPARVRELVGRRVQRLSQATRAVLSAAAVIGSEFDHDVLAEVMDAASPGHLMTALDEAVEGRLLVELPHAIGRYGFSHALIQQALYEEQTLNHRAALHEQTAHTLERLRPDEPARHAELAYHYARAGGRHAEQVVRHGRAAGEHALQIFAYEDAIRDLSAALAALDSLPADERRRADLLALLGSARTRAGDYPAARSAFHEAAELSAAASAWPVLARAVLGYGGGAGFGGVWVASATVDEELVRLLELALAACPAGDSHERVRLLGRLAQALYWSPNTERALALSEEAVVSARRLGDRAALAYALDSRHVVLWGPDHLDEGRALAEEMLQLGRELGDRDIQLEALAWLITDALERDPIDVVDGFISEHARIATELRQPYHLWYTEATRAMRAHLDGRFEEAAELSEKAHAYGQQSHGDNALQTYLVQTMFVKLDLGRLDELIEPLQGYVAASPLPAWRAALALALAGLDRREQALEQVGAFAEHGFGAVRRDCVWMTTLTAFGRTVAHFDDPTFADDLYELLLPFADRNCVVGGAVLCLGPISRILGMLARAAGRPDVALEHFAHALEISQALGSPPLVARTQLEAAKAHLLRATDGDRKLAERLLGDAAATASATGMQKLRHDIDLVRSSLEQGVPA
jgi:class 3 adenylate cyclase